MEPLGLKGKEKASDDAFFMERLEMLYEQSLADLRAFSDREGRPYEEVKRRIAELHCRSLFDGSNWEMSVLDRKQLLSHILQAVSQQLESLETLLALQSFFLVVNPNDQEDAGFLGGTVMGREFWRGHRGCGAAGAEAFKAQCLRTRQKPQLLQPPASPFPPPHLPPVVVGTSRKKGPAGELKAELYGVVRDALRAASGIRNAEMKWTNHSKLDAYGVKLVGYPESIPLANPSSLSASQNRLLLDLFASGKTHFARIDGAPIAHTSVDEPSLQKDEDAIFEASIDYSWASTDHASGHTVPSEINSAARASPTPSPQTSEAWGTPSALNSGWTQNSCRIASPKRRRVDDD